MNYILLWNYYKSLVKRLHVSNTQISKQKKQISSQIKMSEFYFFFLCLLTINYLKYYKNVINQLNVIIIEKHNFSQQQILFIVIFQYLRKS